MYYASDIRYVFSQELFRDRVKVLLVMRFGLGKYH
jgi:hypothetical protein